MDYHETSLKCAMCNESVAGHLAYCRNGHPVVVNDLLSSVLLSLKLNFWLLTVVFYVHGFVYPKLPIYIYILYLYLHFTFIVYRDWPVQRAYFLLLATALIILGVIIFSYDLLTLWFVAVLTGGVFMLLLSGLDLKRLVLNVSVGALLLFWSINFFFRSSITIDIETIIAALRERFAAGQSYLTFDETVTIGRFLSLRSFLGLAIIFGILRRFESRNRIYVHNIFNLPRPIGIIGDLKWRSTPSLRGGIWNLIYESAIAVLQVCQRIARTIGNYIIAATNGVIWTMVTFVNLFVRTFLFLAILFGQIVLHICATVSDAVIETSRILAAACLVFCVPSSMIAYVLMLAGALAIEVTNYTEGITGAPASTLLKHSFSLFLSILLTVVVGGFAINPTVYRNLWWQRFIPGMTLFEMQARTKGEMVVSSAGNYLLGFLPPLFLLYYGNLSSFILIGHLTGWGPYRLGVIFGLCSAILLILVTMGFYMRARTTPCD